MAHVIGIACELVIKPQVIRKFDTAMWGSRSLPVIKLQFITFTYKMVNASPADAAILEPTDDLHEDPFVLPDVLGYLRMPDMARWVVPNNLSRRETGDSSSKAAIRV